MMKNYDHSKLFLITSFFILSSFYTLAQIPAGYYNDANGKTGYALKTALYDIIKGHNAKSYGALWELYKISDKKPNGKVWDMYSDVPGGTPAYEYTFVSDQCGNYSGEGSCYNREHSFPKSWFDDASPMITDPFHIVPSDGYVNGRRGNNPYGEVGSATWTSTNGSKLGSSNYPGYSGTAFEPIDEYKGDLARGYFYMATRYENIIANWENNNSNGDAMLNGTSEQVYEDWALEMLIAWHNADPVSQKEIDRNNAIYDFQGNRNPFIDHPDYVASIWGGTPSATITVSSSLVDFVDISFGEVSNVQSYTVAGATLVDDIIITSTNGYEISTTNVAQDFTTSLTLPQSGGTVASTAIYVRFKPLSDSNGVVNGQIIHTSTGASTKTTNVSGSEKDDTKPSMSLVASLVDFGAVDFGESSTLQSYTISAVNLTESIAINIDNGFEISFTENDQDFGSSLALSQSGGIVTSTTIYVRFKPTSDSNQSESGSITHTSQGASTQTLNVTGTEYYKVVPELNFSYSYRGLNPAPSYEVTLYADIAPNDNLTVSIENVSNTNFVYGETYATEPALLNNIIEIEWLSGSVNASFTIDFIANTAGVYTPGSLNFSLIDDENYKVGTNGVIEIEIKGDDVVNALSDKIMGDFYFYPNPVSNQLSIDWNRGAFNYSITDMAGKQLLHGKGQKIVRVDVASLKAGQYVVHLSNYQGVITRTISVYK